MDRNREARRASNMAAPPANGISRRRHRSNSLRDSPGITSSNLILMYYLLQDLFFNLI